MTQSVTSGESWHGMPRGIHKLGAEAALFSIPIFTIIIDVIAIVLLFALNQMAL